MNKSLETLVIGKTWRVPVTDGPAGDGAGMARRFDSALMSAGFKCSRELLEHLSSRDPNYVVDTAVPILALVREAVGGHVQHNSYFKDFPFGVPDTIEFWVTCLREAVCGAATAAQVEVLVGVHPVSGHVMTGGINLLSLPTYGTYQHTYEELLAAHEEFIPAAGDRVTLLYLGGSLTDELGALYVSLAGRNVPPSDEDKEALAALAEACLDGPQPQAVPVRENRAVINKVRLAAGRPLLVDTVTDVLRLAAAVSGGDVGLQAPAKLRSFTRPERRVLLAALENVVAASPAKLGDVAQYGEQWKRLGERLHPHEHPLTPGAQKVFAVARGEVRVPSFSALLESAMATGDVRSAASLLSSAPGRLFRSLDWLLRHGDGEGDVKAVLDAMEATAGAVSGRVLLSVREHFGNRHVRTDVSRIFVNRNGRARAAADTRAAFPVSVVDRVCTVIDAEMRRRLPEIGHLVVDPAVLGVALPLSQKTAPKGFGVMPRGSVELVDGEWLRFFCYWKQRERRTDYDLSAVMLDASFEYGEHVSWTNYRTGYAEYSGDLTDATNGASEFINIRLASVSRRFIVPQVYLYAGEAFDETEESFFGYMLRSAEQKGLPFEPAAVRMKSEMRGGGRIALPVVFARGDDGKWRAKWLHLYLKGHPGFNQVEGARVTTSLLVRSIVERDYLRVRYLVDLLQANGTKVDAAGFEIPQPTEEAVKPVTYIGLDRPDGLPEGSQVFTLANLADLIPA